ncbi:MAG TPA: CotH kinase family protein [Chitinophagales bacterium]|nr:CotH kinase family protein [Chitinophagales bacterium]
MNYYSIFIFCCLFFKIFLVDISAQSIVINELMAKNTNSLQDEDGDYSDWIELYNTTDSAIDLLNYKLSDDKTNPNKWVFPEVSILPKSYLLIFASDKNRLDIAELHTNFKISTSGEKLYLFNDFGELIDQTDAIDLSSDESYCRIPDGSSNWVVINTPTPNSSNNNSNILQFSHQEGFYQSSFSLIIDALLEDTIYYTLNGDVPTDQSNVLSNSLLINDQTSKPNVFSEIQTTPEQNLISYKAWESPSELIDKATILRCVSYSNGVKTSKVYTKTYFVDDNIFDKYTLPVISLVTEENNLFSSDSGIYVPGVNYNKNDPEWTGNYFMRGKDWERDVHVEYFTKEGRLGFSQDAGIRIHGGKTRQATQKSLRLYARNEYGKKYFNYKLLPQKEVENYKRFMLRTTMGSWDGQTIIKDVLAHDISRGLNIDYQDFQPVIVFLNGEYWGIQTIRDVIDENYLSYTHNIDPDSIEIKDWYNYDYNQLLKFIENNDLTLSSNYEYVKTKIDMGNYIDYTIAEFFFANYDWPSNNMDVWRKLPDGKWRWIFYDIDAGFGNEDYNMYIHSTRNDSTVTWPNSPYSTFLFRNLLKNKDFVSQFINRYAEILNNNFDLKTTTSKLESIKKLYEPEIDNHINRWNYPDSKERWEKDIENELLTFLQERPCIVKSNTMFFFKLSNFDFDCDTTVNITENVANQEDLILAPNPNTGNFFLLNDQYDIINASVIMMNLNGQIIYKEENFNLAKNERKYFDLSNLPSNTYILHIRSTNYTGQKKIIIVK